MGNLKTQPIFFPYPELHELSGPDADGDFYRPATLEITTIWYRYDYNDKCWFWTPEPTKRFWISVSELVVPQGVWTGQIPAPVNVKIIKALHRINPRPTIRFVRSSGMEIGHGRFGEVMRYSVSPGSVVVGQRLGLDSNPQYCAVKHLSIGPNSRNDAVTRELTILTEVTRAKHENIVHHWGWQYHQESLDIIMECCSGDLRSLIRTKPLSMDIMNVLIKDVLQGLIFLHSQDIIHRNIKPENILFTTNRAMGERSSAVRFKLTDFGISRSLYSVPTLAHVKVFTSGYTPPEVFVNPNYNSIKRDIWSFGVVLYECVFHNIKPYDGVYQRNRFNAKAPTDHYRRVATSMMRFDL